MRLNVLAPLAAVLLLAACADDPKPVAATGGTGTAATTAQPPAPPSGPRPGSQEHLAVNAGDRVFFDYDRSTLKDDARRTLERQAAWLRQFPNARFMVEGHADERGTREYNIALGQRRANAARDYLVAVGIPANRLATISYGKERPAVTGTNEAAFAQNRRAVSMVQ